MRLAPAQKLLLQGFASAGRLNSMLWGPGSPQRSRLTQPVGKTLTLNGWSMYYEEAGSGPVVLFVHGGFPSLVTHLQREQAKTWTWSWECDFARHYRFIWYDRRGCYRSSSPLHGYGFETQAADIADLLDSLHINSVHLIGSSAGGPIAILFAATHPSRVRSLTLAGTGLQLFPENDPIVQIIKDYRRAVSASGVQALLDSRPPKAMASFEALWEQPEYEQRGQLEECLRHEEDLRVRTAAVAPDIRGHFYQIELAAFQAYMEADLQPHAELIRCPSLVVHGNADRMVPVEWGRSLAQSLHGSQLKIVPKGSHSLVQRSEEIRAAILDFMHGAHQKAE